MIGDLRQLLGGSANDSIVLGMNGIGAWS